MCPAFKPSICIIDDKIPHQKGVSIIPGKMLNSSNLNLLLTTVPWDEQELYSLVKILLDGKYEVNAFARTELFKYNFEESNYRADIIILDWDADSATPEADLGYLLTSTNSYIAIYTRKDKEIELEALKTKSANKAYLNRIVIFYKDDTASWEKVIAHVVKEYESSFSLQFGPELRKYCGKSLEHILCEFSKLTIPQLVQTLGTKDDQTNNFTFDTNELASIIIEKMRNDLIFNEYAAKLPEPNGGSAAPAPAIVKYIWNYRIFYHPKDDVVRKGDIITKTGEANTLYLVISSNCDLLYFWKKNRGYLALIPLHIINISNTSLKNKLLLENKVDNLKKARPTSIVNTSNLNDAFVITSIKTSDGKLEDYIACPKEIFTLKIPTPPGNTSKIRLKYTHLSPGYSGSKRCCLIEPFISLLVDKCITAISDIGLPDYPESLQNHLNSQITRVFE